MKAFGRVVTIPPKGHTVERRVLVCEICGERLDIDRESGERRCPLCEIPAE